MPPSLSKSQVRRLGERLCKNTPAGDDFELLATLQDEYLGALEAVDYQLRETLGLASDRLYDGVRLSLSNRLKRDRRIIEKLRRGTELDRMQDIVGFRIVGEFTLGQQDDLVREIRDHFSGRAKDRRTEPSYGYRAVHVVADVDGFLVEVQVRTFWQDLWAQGMEGLSDMWGRDIQYGGEPEGPDDATRAQRSRVIDTFKSLSPAAARLEEAEDERRRLITELEEIEDMPVQVVNPVRLGWLRDRLIEADAEVSASLSILAEAVKAYTSLSFD